MNQNPCGRRIATRCAIAALALVAQRASAELTDKNVHLPPTPPTLPAAGQTFVDPTFGSTILRLTGPADGNDNYNVYSYWPTFNRGSTRLFIGTNGSGTLYNFNPVTMQASNKRALFSHSAPDGSIPRWDDAFWSGSDPNVLYAHSNLKLWAYNVNTTNYSLVKDFSSELPAGHLFHLTKSVDDNTFTFTKQDPDYVHTGNFVWRRDTNQIVYTVNDPANTNELQVDKSGRYVMVSHNAQGADVIQTTIRDLQTNTSTPLEDDGPDYAPGHGDLGHGFSVAADNWNNRLTGRSLADPHNPYTVINWADWSQSDHTSMQADDETWALTSLFDASNGQPSTGLFHDEILLVKTDGSTDVRRLAHHQSVFVDGDPATEDYWNTPRANISYDGKFVTFTSNWGNSGRRDVFVLRVGGAPSQAWAVNASGSWHSAANWNAGSVPYGAGIEAELSGVITANRTIVADSPVLLGTLRFDDNNTYVVTGAASLTMQVLSGSALIDVQQGSHKVNLPLIIASDTNVNVASAAALTIADPVTVNAGMDLSHSGDGTVTYQSIVTLEAGATISFAESLAAQAVARQSGAAANLTVGNNTFTVENDAPSASTALGIVNATGDDGLLVRSTFLGDADLTGEVALDDFDQFLGGFEDGAAASWTNGDFNYSGSVNLQDFDLFLNGLRGQGYVPASLMSALRTFVDDNHIDVDLSTVPEPTALSLLAVGALSLRRRRCR